MFNNQGINVLSLFDGIRTGHLALERADIKVNKYYSSEIDKSAIAIGDKNFPQDIEYKLGDVTKIDENKLKQLPKIDLIMWGSPCQQLSRAGNNKGLMGKSSSLFYEALRMLNWLRENNNSDIKFLMENVEMKREWKEEIDDSLGVKGVLINSNLLSAQNRPRIYWTNIVDNLPLPKDKNIKLIDILDIVDVSNYNIHDGLMIDPDVYYSNSIKLIQNTNGEIRIKQATKLGYIVANDGDGINLTFPNSKTRRGRVIKQKTSTLDRQCDICVYYNNIIRKLNINELEKLQTLPIDYTNCDSVTINQRKSGIGNGWTTDIIAYILSFFKEYTNE